MKKHVPHGLCLGCQKQQKIRKQGHVFLMLMKIHDKGIYILLAINT